MPWVAESLCNQLHSWAAAETWAGEVGTSSGHPTPRSVNLERLRRASLRCHLKAVWCRVCWSLSASFPLCRVGL